MYRTSVRSAPRTLRAILPTNLAPAVPRRFASTAPASRRGTWRGASLRWALAIGAVYWYNTSPIFADEPAPPKYPAAIPLSDADLPTVDALIEEKRRQLAPSVPAPVPIQGAAQAEDTTAVEVAAAAATAVPSEGIEDGPMSGSPEALQEEADQQGAFNPETGEINWDCPCLGGMAHGPCGEEFKTAFSCFVFSTEEPKGMDCIDKFQGMQDCFRKYPEIYGSELADDDDDEDSMPVPAASPAAGTEVVAESTTPAPSAARQPTASIPSTIGDDVVQELKEEKDRLLEAVSEKSFDAADANKDRTE